MPPIAASRPYNPETGPSSRNDCPYTALRIGYWIERHRFDPYLAYTI